jgi:hypothetical protein
VVDTAPAVAAAAAIPTDMIAAAVAILAAVTRMSHQLIFTDP